MAMTNSMIVMVESQKLAEEGKLKYTGNVFKALNLMGEEVVVKEIEPIHTYAGWKARGYTVKRGEKSAIRFPIWHYTKKRRKDMSEEEAQEAGYCYMKTASWFTFDQVEETKKKD